MASDSSSEENVENSRWYCHSCETETEAETEVTLGRRCYAASIGLGDS